MTFPSLTKRPRSLPVLFMSGYLGKEIEDRLTGSEQAEILAKPFDRETLLRRVRAILDRR